MKTSLDHLPQRKQRELARIVEVLHEEFEDALKEATADFKKRGRILKIILFGSYARGTWVDEPHTKKGYKSDYDLLIVVNNRKLTDFAAYWHKAQDRLLRLQGVETPVNFVVHSRREVNTALRGGLYFFVDIRKEGVILYELDDEPLAAPRPLSPTDEYETAKRHFVRLQRANNSLKLAKMAAAERAMLNDAAFLLHQAMEHSYATLLLTLTNYSPPSHNLKHLRQLAEDRDERLVAVWPRDRQRYSAWFNIINEAYVKARYSDHYEISQEALDWLAEKVSDLIAQVEIICKQHVEQLRMQAERGQN
ncbi:nucleotidyltransferase and HEPN domain-containing protein (plasmid) [Sinorhizobium meliloti]|uniref:Nucleotidyltransferase and HEPN domain-containing protein n=1 Tax=Sinorhizobium kummerowiae TaxID=158892 RepID=A0ABY8TFQ8_9HYPH|nr:MULTISPECIES: nucleotidyltransferase and HEPN domain-containing protein [Sinorhizobium]ASJ62361.1 nucleotidyltransferase [Sinorhizobium meliloti]MCK3785286.1 nucleotidyltransferase and HEPN domain-containing protein [Sinorhizobium meliloti]MCK3791411.1 nucleotidyltransferase and HEPN domain-containing protein [Sinorhizobium meliloti]MCK3797459.1 nucleotidyltransferase and HEPN domain-containing protein [Sinorhizobium meliloti]UIJ90874.1 nucleotidyltransferase and HEPN domain-containing prot